jgi:hypothetical protein
MPSEYAAALEYAKAYRGSFEFMVEMRKAAEAGRPFSQGMVTAILRCRERDAARMMELAEAEGDPLDLRGMPEGTTFFAIESGGRLVFLRVDRVVDGSWVGWTFVKEQHGDAYDRVGKQRPGGEYVGGRRDELRAVLADPLAAAIRYGREVGRCAVCHATLTEEKSRELGIGPVCRKRLAA